eukprot:TRINITY_DN8870_c0_g2_i1.p1 TRINITY_DN8870_c0_g2~~TRINITY_DN8870_c0_g2_i1.p1  ORF type:complete len:240 (-),score=13.50 TRINITY_DN8870_c0_g2_i1:93-788(-)
MGGGPGGPRVFPGVKLRGLPFGVEEADVADFFVGLDVADILFVRRDGEFKGEAIVVFANPIHAELSLQRNRMSMGRRYVEIFRCRRADYFNAIAKEVALDGGQYRGPENIGPQGTVQAGVRYGYNDGGGGHLAASQPSAVLKMRGLPYQATKPDIIEFFDGFNLSDANVHVLTQLDGRSTGEAFVEFNSPADALAAMEKDHSRMGSRYVELFASSREEAARGVAKFNKQFG